LFPADQVATFHLPEITANIGGTAFTPSSILMSAFPAQKWGRPEPPSWRTTDCSKF
jgi:hypothetical protein